ncbi:glutamate decarboxylase [Methanobrevibacter curvatus]|uniref:glutamate decarboxylase n=1 Tax=Methanobrevibacter curvatus TaxID=49547 RepID=A0A165ZJM5_9EURY|nr:glutamate decarboxylase [Methanobrevibacter curvatus]KZX10811.1 glutamate decarboxylase [Methanobrevibacter curvatus]
MLSPNHKKSDKSENTNIYGTRYFSQPIPKFEIPKEGMSPKTAYRLIHDELNLDGNTNLNLASFVTTWMEEEADKLIAENNGKNFVDNDEYPQTGKIHDRVINMLAKLFNASKEDNFVGTSTIGSSEAIMLGLLAHKWHWRESREKKGIKNNQNPNIVIGADVHVVWKKFAKYFDVELRMVPMEKDKYILTAKSVKEYVDENTIAVGVVLGTTFTGQIDEIYEINSLLEEVKEKKGWDISIHVDAASGGFVIPFIDPEFKWDFRLSHVRSINVSGHKYGLVYPGVGWLIFKDKKYLSEDLIFNVNYLGGELPTFNLNFSKGSSMVLAQYYNLLRLGIKGYTDIMENLMLTAKYLKNMLKELDIFDFLDEELELPIITMKLKENYEKTANVFEISNKLREHGWIIPAYTMPPNIEEIAVLRIVIKENFSRDMAEMLVKDLKEIEKLYKEHETGNKTKKKNLINIY